MFTKGQLVECIDTSGDPNDLTLRAIYTVYWAGVGIHLGMPMEAVRVSEPCLPPGYTAYEAARFRPLQDSRLDVFRAMLVQTPAPVFVHNGDDGA